MSATCRRSAVNRKRGVETAKVAVQGVVLHVPLNSPTEAGIV